MNQARLAILVVILLCLPAIARAQSPSATLYEYQFPEMDTVVVGDFTGDGIPDLTSG